MYRLAHKGEYGTYLTCGSLLSALNHYYRQERDKDGSIPWRIEYLDNQNNAHIVKE